MPLWREIKQLVGFVQIHETTPNSMLREQPLVDSISLMEHAACPIKIHVQDQVEVMNPRMFKSIIQGTTIQFSVFPSTKIFGTFDEVRHNPCSRYFSLLQG